MDCLASRVAVVALALATLAVGRADAGPLTYQVNVNTSSLNGTSGSLEFQYQTGSTPSNTTATVFNFAGGTPGAVSPPVLGNVTGSLLSPPLVFKDNGSVLNDLLENFTYGSSLSFNVTFSQALSTTGTGAAFELILWSGANGTGTQQLYQGTLASDPSNNPNSPIFGPGAAVILNNGSSANGPVSNPGVVTASLVVPEPGTLALVGLGIGGLLAWRRRRSTRRASSSGKPTCGMSPPTKTPA